MCEALEQVEQTEWDALVKKVNGIDRKVDAQQETIASWRGSARTFFWFFGVLNGIGLVALGVLVTLGISLVNTLHQQDTIDQLHAKAIADFIEEGPRFTPSHFKDKMEVYEARFAKVIDQRISETVPPPEVRQALKKGQDDHDHHTTLIQSLQRQVENLENAVYLKNNNQ